MTDVQAWLDQSREIESKATEGPWGGTWNGGREGNISGEADVLDATNVRAKDLFFITEARTRFPQALKALQAVLDTHHDSGDGLCNECSDGFLVNHPCPTVSTIQDAIGEINE